MEFTDLKSQYKFLQKEINSGIQEVLDRGDYISGKEVPELESHLANYLGRKYCITCANGTDAMLMPLTAWDVKEGDAVFVPAFTFMSTAEVVSLRGATPVFVDIDLETFNIDAGCLEKSIKKVLSEGKLVQKAVIPVDLFGIPADYERILPIAEKYGLLVLEDAAQGFGGTLNGKAAGSFGHISSTSFFPSKPLGCYGDGGAIFTDDEEMCSMLMSIRVHGKGKDKYDNVRIGLNSRLDTIQAAVLLSKLKAFKEFELKKRQEAAEKYTALLFNVVKTPVIPDNFTSSYAQYTLMLEDEKQRDELKEWLARKGIPTMVYYAKPLHRQTAFRHLGYEEGVLPCAERAAKCVLSLPISPYISTDDIGLVAENIIKYLKS